MSVACGVTVVCDTYLSRGIGCFWLFLAVFSYGTVMMTDDSPLARERKRPTRNNNAGGKVRIRNGVGCHPLISYYLTGKKQAHFISACLSMLELDRLPAFVEEPIRSHLFDLLEWVRSCPVRVFDVQLACKLQGIGVRLQRSA